MSKALKINTTLTALDLEGGVTDQFQPRKSTNHDFCAGNKIGQKGAQALSKAVKANTALTALDLEGVRHQESSGTAPTEPWQQ